MGGGRAVADDGRRGSAPRVRRAGTAGYRSTVRAVGPQAWPQVRPRHVDLRARPRARTRRRWRIIRQDVVKAAAENRRAQRGQRLPHQHDAFRLRLGLERRGRELRPSTPGGQRPGADPRVRGRGRSTTCTTCWAATRSPLVGHALGANPFKKPHHRPSGADQNAVPWPGLLSGGPNRQRQDAVLEELPTAPRPDVRRRRSLVRRNENAINWNAPLVFLLTGASAHGRR